MKFIRNIVSNLFEKVIDEKYNNNYVEHFMYGKIDLNTWVKWYTNYHYDFHKKYIDRNLKLYYDKEAKNVT